MENNSVFRARKSETDICVLVGCDREEMSNSRELIQVKIK